MRIENVTLESGQAVAMAALTLEQLDAYIENGTKGDRSAAYKACVDSLNNAGGSWDLDRFKREVTFPEFITLQAAMKRVTGLVGEGEAEPAKG